jgi:hypothetical protein
LANTRRRGANPHPRAACAGWQYGRVPSGPPTVSRRHVLIGTIALALVGTAAAGCGTPEPKPDVDALVAQLDRARADSEMAAAAATTAPPPIASALNTVAAERTAHARALADEITRVTGTAPTTSASPRATPSTSTTATSGGPISPPSAKDVIAALKTASDDAGRAAAQLSGYQAGLLGSIAASCAAASAVGLVVQQAP